MTCRARPAWPPWFTVGANAASNSCSDNGGSTPEDHTVAAPYDRDRTITN